MQDTTRTNADLRSELAALRGRIAQLEASRSTPDPAHTLLHTALHSISFPIYIVDAHTYEIVLANRATHGSLLPKGVTCHALMHRRSTPCSDPESPCPLEHVKRTRQPVVVEHAHYTDEGVVRRFEVHAFPICDGRGRITHVIEHNIDVTQRKRADEELGNHRRSLEMLIATLERSNQELKTFTSVAAHDIRSPMAMVTFAAGSLQELAGDKLDDKGNRVLGILMRSVKRMAEMIASLYRCGQVDYQGVSRAAVDLNQVVDEVMNLQLCAELQRSQGKIDVPEQLHVVLGDEVQLLQLMQNLLANALKYHRKGIAPEITIRSRDAGSNRIRVEVEDNGIGIRDADREKVFGMFHRLDDAHEHEGLGIGLAFCKKVAERHGGNIGVTSTYGSGSTFWVELPKASR